jgi:hypothetical protein
VLGCGVVCAFTLGAGCGDESAGPGIDPGPVPTWWEDVAPIVYGECVSCHQAGGIAPVELVEYEQVKDLAGILAAEVSARTMPPWPAGNSGACNTFVDARWLTETQIDTIARWAKGGAPEGDPANRPDLPGEPPGLPEVSATLDIMVDYSPSAALGDDYRCFVVDPGIDQDMYLTAYEVKPGDPRVVHHVILYAFDDESAEQQAEALDAADTEPGYTCFGGPGVSATFAGGWAPGTPPTIYPAGTGIPLKANRKAVMQIHYNTLNGSFADRTKMDLTLASSVAREAIITPILDASFALPPEQTYVETTSTMPSAPIPVLVHGMYPHMHQLGKNINVSLLRGADEMCMVDVPAWDFNWQQLYLYEEPILVQPGDVLSITCGFSTLGQDKVVTWGDGTEDEMCLNYFYVTLP